MARKERRGEEPGRRRDDDRTRRGGDDRTRRRGDEPRRRRGGARGGWLDRAIRGLVRFCVGVAFRLGVAVALILGAATLLMYERLPASDALLDGRDRGSVTLLDRNGDVFAWRGDQYGGEIRVGDVSPHLVHAILAAEDRRFFSHWGVDPRGLLRAAVANLRAGEVVQGGSTVTQQVAKNVFLTNERSLERKLKEIPMALAMELKYSKDEILSVYLNRVYLGAGAYGFEAASQRYFGKSAKFLDPAEAAMLAGLLRAPSRLAPTNDIERAQARARLVVAAMAEEGYLTSEQAAEARARPARLSDAASARAGGQFADWVMEIAPDYLTRNTTEDVVIATTFDPRIQLAAEAAVDQVFETQVRDGSRAQAAVVVMAPDGAVRAIVGGRGARAGAFNRATQAMRQTGSAFKPFVYAAALERGVSPADLVEDRPLIIGGWTPENYSGRFEGAMTVTDALAESVNTVAVRLSERVGREHVVEVARRLGLTTPLAPGPAVALGTSEATLVEMTAAYAVFANGGWRAPPHAIRELRVRGRDAPLLDAEAGPVRRVLDARVAALLTGMLEEVVERGTGERAALPGRPAAGKTGTTQAARDAWFIGFTADYVAGVWMGYDDNTPLTGVTGGGLPAAIWREAMTRIHEGLPARPLPSAKPAPPAPPAVARAPASQPKPGTMLGRFVGNVIDVFTE